MPTDLLVLLSPKNIILFLVVFTRLGGMFVSAPLFSTYPIPMQVKAWFIATVTVIIFPLVMIKGGFHVPTSAPELFVILLKEFMIGYIIGFVANMLFIAIEMGAEMLSIQMGLSMASALNPMSGTQAPVIGQVYTIMTAIIFIGVNAHQWLFSAVYKSFMTIPPGYGFIMNGTLVKEIMFLSSQIFTIALQVALPVFAVLLISDVLLGFVSKMMPQMNIFMVAMPLKIYLGLLLMIMFLRPTSEFIATVLESFLKSTMMIFSGG